MKLGDYLDPHRVVVDLRPGSVHEILEQLIRPLEEAGEVADPDALLESLEQREALQSTGVGSGVAVPHSVSDELPDPRLVLGLCAAGAEYGALDDRPVHLFFLLLSPSDRTGTHIKLLARIARLVRRTELLDELRQAGDADEAIRAIHAYEQEHV